MHNRIEELQMDLLNCAGLTGVRVVSVKHPARPRDGIHSTALLRSPEGIPWAASVVTGARAFDWDHEQGKVAVEVWRRGPDRKYQRDNAIIYEEAIFAMNLILNEEPNLAAGHAGRVNEVVEQVLANDLKHDRTIARKPRTFDVVSTVHVIDLKGGKWRIAVRSNIDPEAQYVSAYRLGGKADPYSDETAESAAEHIWIESADDEV